MSELRQDITSGDWIILAPSRAGRPKFLDGEKAKRKHGPKGTCPFEHPEKNGNWPPILAYPNRESWEILLIPNKYPAVIMSGGHSMDIHKGIYQARTATGTHALFITRDHKKGFAELEERKAVKLFEMMRSFHMMEENDPQKLYVSTFCNWGPEAGASIGHPHYQTLTLPIVPPHVAHSLRGAKEYFAEHGRCVRCDIVRTERKSKVRIIAENDHAVALAPYASKKPFEVNILPKRHCSSFRETSPAVLHDMALMLRLVMQRLRRYVNDPDLNFFIHDTPLDGKDYRYHHWHIEVVPVNVMSPPGGFEISTAININVIDPEEAASVLRWEKIR